MSVDEIWKLVRSLFIYVLAGLLDRFFILLNTSVPIIMGHNNV